MKNNKVLFLLLSFVFCTPFLNGQDQPKLVLPTGHNSGILTASFSPDCKYIVTGSADNTAKLWDVSSGKLLHTIYGHTGWVNYSEFSSDGSIILTVSTDSTVKLWNASNGILLRIIKGQNSNIISAGFSPQGNTILTVNFGDNPQVWDTQSGKMLFSLNGHTENVESAVYSADGAKILTTSWDKSVRIWDSKTGKQLNSLKKQISRVSYACFSPDGKNILTASMDEGAGVWDAETGKLLFTLNGSSEYISFATYSQDGKEILVNSHDETAYIYNSNTGELICKIDDHYGRLYTVAFSSDSKSILTAGAKDDVAKIWDIQSGKLLFKLEGHKNNLINAAYSSDRKLIVTTSNDNTAKIWDSERGKLLITLENKTDNSAIAFFNADGKEVITQNMDGGVKTWSFDNGKLLGSFSTLGNIRIFLTRNPDNKITELISYDDKTIVWDVKTGEKLLELEDYVESLNLATYSPDGKTIITCSSHDLTKLWDAKSGKLLFSFFGQEESVSSATFSPDGKIVLTSYQDDTAKLWNTTTGDLIYSLEPHTVSNSPAQFSPDGKTIAIPSWDNSVRIWDTQTGKVLFTLAEHKAFVNFAIYSPDGNSILIGSADKTLKIWDSNTGKIIHTLIGHEGFIREAFFSTDGRKIVSRSDDMTVKVWDVQNGQILNTFTDHAGYLSSAKFSPDGKTILSSATDSKYVVRDAETGKLLFTHIQLCNDDWLVYDEYFRYDGTQIARDYLYFVCGNEIIELTQMKDALYVPGLEDKIRNAYPINYPKLEDLEICGTTPLVEKLDNEKGLYSYSINPRNSEFDHVEVYINDKLIYSFSKSQLIEDKDKFILNIEESEISKHFILGTENKIKVIAVSKHANSEIRSRGVTIKLNDKNPGVGNPRLFIVMIGVNDYKDANLALKFPATDATELGAAIEYSAEKFLGDTSVNLYMITSNFKPGSGYASPEKESIRLALEDIGKKSNPEDVILIFFAGHGVMQGSEDKVFTFLTSDASSENQIGISTTELQQWISFDGPNKILANKTILIFDACNSGQATKELLAFARSDDETQRIRQVEDLRDKSGLFILTASAPNQYAYEFPQYNHGLLTYCLLYELKNNPKILDDSKYLNVSKWFLETEEYLNQLVTSLGYKQDAQPYGTANIRIGIVDSDVQNKIVLASEKPVIICANVMNEETFDDDLHLKALVNSKLSEISERGIDQSLLFPQQETENANKINIRYSLKNNQIKCDIRLIKQGETLMSSVISSYKNELDILTQKIIDEVLKFAK